VSQAQVQSDGGAEAKGWAALGSMIAGPAFYGGLGWLLDRLTGHDGLFVVIGLALGGVLAMVSVFYRFWR
jgi:ATP synthase protein I